MKNRTLFQTPRPYAARMNRRSALPLIIGFLLLPMGCVFGDSTGPYFASLDISPTTATLTAIGDTVRFTAVSRDSVGAVTGAGALVVWYSSDPKVVSVGINSGLATAVANGTTTVFAQFPSFVGFSNCYRGGCQGGATLTVDAR